MRSLVIVVLLLLAMLASTVIAQAQGVPTDPTVSPLMPPRDDQPLPTPRPELLIFPGPVRIKLYRVGVTIKDQVATTHVEQVFVNDGRMPVEGTYLFPLPTGAAISEFNMFVDGQKIEGQIMRKEEARAIYESIVRRRRDPALLEYVGHDLFQARIFPIPPGGERKIELTYSQVLSLDNGLIHYQYPLRIDRFSQRPVDQLAISLNIESSSRLKAIYSPSHEVVVYREGDYKAQVGYEDVNVLPTIDFDLYYSVDEREVGVSLLSYKPAGEDGFFLLLAAPNVEVDPNLVVARDVLLVLDTSGSMKGQKIVQARNALLYVLERLNPEDRFNIIAFSTGIRQFERGPQPAGRVPEAKGFVNRLEAGGGTDINRALLEALAQVDPARPTVIIFLTDGLPTEGETDVQRIIRNVRQNTGPNVQVFTFGVGDDVNTVLLDTIAQENRGASAYVRPNQAIDEIVSAFYAKVSTPVLAGLSLDFGNIFVEDLYPYPLPDLFAGTQLVLVGRYREGGATAITLRGTVNGQEKAFVFEDLTFRDEGGEPFIARLWATRKIGHLLNQIRLHGQSQELIDEIVALSTRYGIATPYTSYFVPEPELAMPMPAEESGRPMSTPVPRPAEAPAPAAVMPVEKVVEATVQAAAPAIAEAPAAGAEAVEESQAREALRSADRAPAGEAAGLRYAGDKAFAYQAGLWVDTTYKIELPKVELAFGSAEYFDLLDQHPEWATYFAVSPNLIVVLDGTAYVVTDTGTAAAEPGVIAVPAVSPTPAVAAQPPALPPVQQPGQAPAPICAAPFGLGLLLVPVVWSRRRSR